MEGNIEDKSGELSVGRGSREAVLAGLAIFIAVLFMCIEMLRKDQLHHALTDGRRVEISLEGGKAYARLREETKQVLDMTAHADGMLAEERKLQSVTGVEPEEQQETIKKNTQLVKNFLSVWEKFQEEARIISFRGIAQK